MYFQLHWNIFREATFWWGESYQGKPSFFFGGKGERNWSGVWVVMGKCKIFTSSEVRVKFFTQISIRVNCEWSFSPIFRTSEVRVKFFFYFPYQVKFEWNYLKDFEIEWSESEVFSQKIKKKLEWKWKWNENSRCRFIETKQTSTSINLDW